MKHILATISLLILVSSAQGQDDLTKIKSNISAFSVALMAGDTVSVNNAYTIDGKILPNGRPILAGESLRAYWNSGIRKGQIYYHHKVTPTEIKVIGDHAYDYGYYEGESGNGGKRSKWKGKYVIIWRKVGGDWKIFLDIWNSVPLTD
jgi:ketosteroid isomerase-like protein